MATSITCLELTHDTIQNKYLSSKFHLHLKIYYMHRIVDYVHKATVLYVQQMKRSLVIMVTTCDN